MTEGEEAKRMDQKNPVILIVDDHPDNLSVLYDVLDTKNYDVRVARDGRNALEIIKNDLPDLVLLDVIMPGMNGFEVCAKLKASKETKDIPVIFMTALTETVNKVRGFELGAFDYITKPFQIEVVLSQIRNCLRLYGKEREYHRLRSDLSKIAEKDLRTPLYMISSGIRQLTAFSANMPQEQLKKEFESMRGHVNTANGILETFETVFDFDGGKTPKRMEVVDAAEFFGRIAEEFESAAGDSAAIHFTSNVSDCLVKIDPTLLEHAVWNLLSVPDHPDSENRSVRFEISIQKKELVLSIHNPAGPGSLDAIREAEWLARVAGGRLSTGKDGYYILTAKTEMEL